MEDIGWLDVRRIHSDAVVGAQDDMGSRPSIANDLGVVPTYGSTVRYVVPSHRSRLQRTHLHAVSV